MATHYIPTLENLRGDYHEAYQSNSDSPPDPNERNREFDQAIAKIKAEALRSAALTLPISLARDAVADYADQIEKEAGL